MNETKYVEAVLAAIPKREPADEAAIIMVAKKFHADGIEHNDAVQYVRCMEECNPLIPEATALRRMAELCEKWRANPQRKIT